MMGQTFRGECHSQNAVLSPNQHVPKALSKTQTLAAFKVQIWLSLTAIVVIVHFDLLPGRAVIIDRPRPAPRFHVFSAGSCAAGFAILLRRRCGRCRCEDNCRARALSVFGTTAHTHLGRVDSRDVAVPVPSDRRVSLTLSPAITFWVLSNNLSQYRLLVPERCISDGRVPRL
jgi:hypothetical protein